MLVSHVLPRNQNDSKFSLFLEKNTFFLFIFLFNHPLFLLFISRAESTDHHSSIFTKYFVDKNVKNNFAENFFVENRNRQFRRRTRTDVPTVVRRARCRCAHQKTEARTKLERPQTIKTGHVSEEALIFFPQRFRNARRVSFKGATTLSIMTLSIMTLGIMTLGIVTLGIITINIQKLKMRLILTKLSKEILGIRGISCYACRNSALMQFSDLSHKLKCHYAEFDYAECHYA